MSTENTETVISINHVSKVYKLFEKPMDRLKESLSLTHKNYHTDHFALEDISLEVHKGECVGIIGTNGSGKSTLLKIVTGVLNPTSGNVELKGRVSAILELGAGFNMEYTGIENIFLNGTMLGYTEEEMKAKLDDSLRLQRSVTLSISRLRRIPAVCLPALPSRLRSMWIRIF